MTVTDLQRLNQYNQWATGRLLDVAATVDPDRISAPLGATSGSLLDTFRHIMGAEWIWLERFHGRSPRAFEGEPSLGTLAAVRARWTSLDAAYDAFLAALTDDALVREVPYASLKGDPFRHPLQDLLQHVFNHSTYHRGQAAMSLRLLGAQPVSTDLIVYIREHP